MTYNGHRNYNFWNVSLWFSNDEGLYNLARETIRRCKTKDAAARELVATLAEAGITKTPDGAPYTVSAVRAALTGL
jgi:hypothetical protein